MRTATSILGLILWIAACFLVISSGSLVQETGPGTWYDRLDKPAWTPPGWVFGPAWAINCLLMGTAAWLVWRRGGWSDNRGALGLFVVQLLVTGSFSWVFTPLESPLLGALIVTASLGLVLATAVVFARKQWLAGALLVPYALWLAFAGSVAWGLVALN